MSKKTAYIFHGRDCSFVWVNGDNRLTMVTGTDHDHEAHRAAEALGFPRTEHQCVGISPETMERLHGTHVGPTDRIVGRMLELVGETNWGFQGSVGPTTVTLNTKDGEQVVDILTPVVGKDGKRMGFRTNLAGAWDLLKTLRDVLKNSTIPARHLGWAAEDILGGGTPWSPPPNAGVVVDRGPMDSFNKEERIRIRSATSSLMMGFTDDEAHQVANEIMALLFPTSVKPGGRTHNQWMDYYREVEQKLLGEVQGLRDLLKLREEEADHWKNISLEHDAEIDQARVQLAGCLTAAEGGTSDPATQGQYGWSPAYEAVKRLRTECDKLKALKPNIWEELAAKDKTIADWQSMYEAAERSEKKARHDLEVAKREFSTVRTDLATRLRAATVNVAGGAGNAYHSDSPVGKLIADKDDELDKLKAFKSYVHTRLDRAGVPPNPDPTTTSATSCRIGPRLDWVFERLQLARDQVSQMKDRFLGAASTVAKMHEAAVGEVRGPDVGPIEDVAKLRHSFHELHTELLQVSELLNRCDVTIRSTTDTCVTRLGRLIEAHNKEIDKLNNENRDLRILRETVRQEVGATDAALVREWARGLRQKLDVTRRYVDMAREMYATFEPNGIKKN